MAPRLIKRAHEALRRLRARARQASRPRTGVVTGFLLDRFRSRAELERENALLRKQLEVLVRTAGRPKLRPLDRVALVLLAPSWLPRSSGHAASRW